MKQVIFATGNQRKIAEAMATLQPYDVTVLPQKIAMDEIQHRDPVEVTKAKAGTAFAVTGRPVVVSDTSWSVPALGGFPGAYMKDIGAWLQPEDWLGMMRHHNDKRIMCHEHVAFYDGTTLKHFQSDYEGHFVDTPRGRDDDEESFEKVVVLYGDKTMAEQLEAGELASAGEELEHWQQFGVWYQTYETAV